MTWVVLCLKSFGLKICHKIPILQEALRPSTENSAGPMILHVIAAVNLPWHRFIAFIFFLISVYIRGYQPLVSSTCLYYNLIISTFLSTNGRNLIASCTPSSGLDQVIVQMSTRHSICQDKEIWHQKNSRFGGKAKKHQKRDCAIQFSKAPFTSFSWGNGWHLLRCSPYHRHVCPVNWTQNLVPLDPSPKRP